MGKDLNKYFPKDMQNAKAHIERCSTLLAIKEMQLKTIMRYYFTAIRTAIIFNFLKENKHWQRRGEIRILIVNCWWEYEMMQRL